MAEVNTATFINRYNNGTTGLFKDNITGDIEAVDTRDLVQYIADSFLNFLDDVLDEDAMTSNSATQVPTQQSVKAYADTKWPLGGAADLSASITLDGNNFAFSIGSPNFLDTFEVFVDNTIGLYSNDGVDSSYLEVVPNQVSLFGKEIIRLDIDDGAGGTGVFQMHNVTGFLFESSIQLGFGANDGVSNSSFILEPDHYHIALEDAHIHSDGNSISLEMDDGVDSSSLTLTPTTVDVVSDSITLDGGTSGVELITTGTILNSLNGGGAIFVISDNGNSQTIKCGFGNALEYDGDYSAAVLANSRSIPDISTINLLPMSSYTVATLPSASPAGKWIYVTDETGGAIPAFSDGTNWRRVTDRAIVA